MPRGVWSRGSATMWYAVKSSFYGLFTRAFKDGFTIKMAHMYTQIEVFVIAHAYGLFDLSLVIHQHTPKQPDTMLNLELAST